MIDNEAALLALPWKHLGEGVVIHAPCIILKPEEIEIYDNVRIDGFVKIEGGKGVILGEGIHIGSFAHINVGGGRVIFSDYSAAASGARILAGSNMPAGRSMSIASPREMQVIHRGATWIASFAFVGAGAIVLFDRMVGEGAVVAAGAVVTHDVPPWEIWGGNPAHKIGERERPRER